MKFTHIIAAGLMLAGVGVSTQATAQPGPRHHERGPDRGPGHDRGRDWRGDRHDRWDRHDNRRWDRHDRRDRRWGRHDRGRHYGWRGGNRRDCRIVYRYGQRQRICR